ncbi:MAG: ATP-binding protein [Leptolyngbyaceae cyanobacterium]
MNFERRKISYKFYLKLLERAEAQLIDFKDKRIKPSKLCQTVSALANSDGGEIFVGITEQPERKFAWDGFRNEEEANGIIQAVEEILYLNCPFEVDFLAHEKSGLVLRITICKASKVIYTSARKAYRRSNARNVELKTVDEIRQLELNKGAATYEDMPIDAALEVISDSEVIYQFLIDNDFDIEPNNFLRKNNLIKQDSPRVSGVLLFADYPQAFVNRCGIKVIRYNTSADIPERKDMLDTPMSVEGCLYKLIYSAVSKVQHIVGTMPCTDQGYKVDYPQETLHEIIANAVLHRDYSIQDDIHIRIFNNRIEVESPGLLPGYITVQNILSQRFSRNGTLVRIINKFSDPPNKDIGEGLNTAFEAMRHSGLIYPKIKQKESSVLVVIYNEKLPNSTEVFLELLSSHEILTSYEINRKKIFKNDYQRNKTIKKLKDTGVIEKVPYTWGIDTAYRFTIGSRK